MPPSSSTPRWHLPAYLGGLATLTAVAADHYLDIIKWKRIRYTVPIQDNNKIAVSLRARTRPPPIGQMEWPGGRFLLQYLLDECGFASSGAILEIGAGIGLTSCGLAKARKEHLNNHSPIIATDYDEPSLQLLRSNAAENECSDIVKVAHWDAASGDKALKTLPINLSELSHVIASDVVYHGFGVETDPSGDGLPKTLSALLHAKPSLDVTILLTDRFSGGAVAAFSGAAGVNTATAVPTTVDPELARFEATCHGLGLTVRREPIPAAVLERVASSQWPLARFYWWMAGWYEEESGMSVVRVELDDG